MQIDISDLSREEIIGTYEAIYYYKLNSFELSIPMLQEYIKELIETEEFEGCAGIKRAIDRFMDENPLLKEVYGKDAL